MENDPFDKIIPEFDKKVFKIYDDTIKKVESKHLEYFKNRESNRPDQDHDTLFNHFILRLNGREILTRPEQNSDLDDAIRQETIKELSMAFDKL